MKSKKPIELLGKIINFGHRVGFTPYKFDAPSSTTTFDSSRVAQLKYWGNVGLLACYEGFIAFRYIQSLLDKQTHLQGKIRGFYVCFLYSALNINHYIFIRNYGTIQFFWNEFMATTSTLTSMAKGIRFSEEQMVKLKALEKKNRLAIIGAMMSTAIPALIRAIKVLRKPQSPELVSSVFSNPEELSMGSRILLSLLQLNVTGFHGYTMVLTAGIIITYTFSCLPILQILKFDVETPSWQYALKGKAVQQVNKRLVTLQTFFNSFYKLWPLVGELCCIGTIIIRLFLAVKLGTVKDFVAGLSMLFTIIIFFIGFAEIHVQSEEAQRSWVSIQQPPWFPKYLRACRSLRVTIGNFYYADQGLILTIISIVITNTTSLVLATGKFDDT